MLSPRAFCAVLVVSCFTGSLVLLPTTASPEEGTRDLRERLLGIADLYEAGRIDAALDELGAVRRDLAGPATDSTASPLRSLDTLRRALFRYRLFAYGRRPDLDATHDAVLRVLDDLVVLYRQRGVGPARQRYEAVDFDLHGRIVRVGSLELDYVPFSDRLDQIGSIEIEYVPFEEYPRRVGPIEFDWVFDRLRAVAGVTIDPGTIPRWRPLGP